MKVLNQMQGDDTWNVYRRYVKGLKLDPICNYYVGQYAGYCLCMLTKDVGLSKV